MVLQHGHRLEVHSRVVASAPVLVEDHVLDAAAAAAVLPVSVAAAGVAARLDVLDAVGLGLGAGSGRDSEGQHGGESVHELHDCGVGGSESGWWCCVSESRSECCSGMMNPNLTRN